MGMNGNMQTQHTVLQLTIHTEHSGGQVIQHSPVRRQHTDERTVFGSQQSL